MKKVNLFYLCVPFVPLLLSSNLLSANTNTQAPIWPSNVMMPYTYQWPMQQAKLPTQQTRQMLHVFPTNNRLYPLYQGMPAYNMMRYPQQTYPLMQPPAPARKMLPQQQAAAVYPAMPTINNQFAPVQQGQYRYPTQYPQTNANAQKNGQAPYRKPAQMQNNFKKKPKPWGDTRYIWPDFYTDATGDMWDNMMNAPYDMGRMPGGWRFPSLSSPDPVTVGDAVTNQFPPIMDEVPNFMPFMN